MLHLVDASDAQPVPLNQLRPGQKGIVQFIDGPPPTTRRLMELGLVPGTLVEFVRCAPLGCPFELRVRGTHLSIRRSDAAQIHVDPA